MRIEPLSRYRTDHPRGGGFLDLPTLERQNAQWWFERFVHRRRAQGKPIPPWLNAIYHRQARRLARNPPTPEWGRRMLAKRGGYAVQRSYRMQGRNPTAAATRAHQLLATRLTRHPTQPKHPLPDLSVSLYEGRLAASTGREMRVALARAIVNGITDPRTMESSPPVAWRWVLALGPM